MLQLLTINAAIFFGVTLVCVILYTVKSITLIKCSTLTSAIMTAVAFGVNTIAIKLTAEAALMVTIPLTVIANFLGVYIAKWILHLFQKDKLWRISCTILHDSAIISHEIQQKLNTYNIKSIIVTLEEPYGHIIEIFSKTQGESTLIKEIINKNNIKYTVYEIDKTL